MSKHKTSFPVCSEDVLRGTGRTTRRAVSLILEAMRNPGLNFLVKDHYDRRDAHENLVNVCWDLVIKMELDGFTFNKSALTIRCDFKGLK